MYIYKQSYGSSLCLGETEKESVTLYIGNTINYEHLFDLEFKSLGWIGIKEIKPNTEPFHVCTWYRPPRANVDTLRDFPFSVQQIESLGDLNCNVVACQLESHTKILQEICNLYQYQQLINVHTQITGRDGTTTTNLFLTNSKEIFSHSGVCHIGIG